MTAVNLKSALYRGFQATMGRVITVMSAILIAFALVIAGGTEEAFDRATSSDVAGGLL